MRARASWSVVLGALVIGVSAPGAAIATDAPRRILISDDDGLTSNVKALYDALKARGYDVIVSVPCENQSAMGGALRTGTIPRVATGCLHRAARAGDPGAGPMTRPGLPAGDFHYVNGTPVMATLYGITMLAPARWGGPPDLVLSGPNIGPNVGPGIVSSGTVNNVQHALLRGIPAIALSAGMDTAGDDTLADPRSAAVATRAVALVAALDRRARGKPMLPPGVALNVNFPERLDGARWTMSRVGTFNPYETRFVADRLTLGVTRAAPSAAQRSDEAVMAQRDITVSVLQLAYGAPQGSRRTVVRQLGSVLKQAAEDHRAP